MKSFGYIIAAGLLTLMPFSAQAKEKAKATAHDAVAPEVTLQELKALVDAKGATIIDANSAKVYDSGHIPGAVSFAKNEKTLANQLPKDKNTLIVAYCGGPMCTAWEDPAKQAKTLGYSNIKHFKGGLKTWKDSGYPLEAAKK